MEILSSAVFLFISGTLVHVILWRIKLPSAQTMALLKIYVGTYLIWLGLWGSGQKWFWIHSLADLIQCTLLYGAILLAYIVTYSAVEAESPTLTIMMIVHEGPATGTRLDQIYAYVDGHPFLRARLDALLSSGALVIENDVIKVGRPPSVPLRLVMDYRTLFGHLQSIG
jgi:hypothetical protein